MDHKIGIYLLEPKYFNAAASQVSSYYKGLGYTVELYNHLDHWSYIKIYAFSLFDFTPKTYVTRDMIAGGTGFNITSRLPPEIEAQDYDYSLFPKCQYSFIRFSMGCIRNKKTCPWCVVPDKEGKIRPVDPKNLNSNGKWIMVADNNFFANPKWGGAIEKLKEWDQPVTFEGVDARILNPDMCRALLEFRHYKQIKMAWDNPRVNMVPIFERIFKHIPAYKIMVYVLIGYKTPDGRAWSTHKENLDRVLKIDALGMDPYVMPFNKKDEYQKQFKRWVNRKALFKTCTWDEYKRKIKTIPKGQTILELEN